jgi:hypothetical protein
LFGFAGLDADLKSTEILALESSPVVNRRTVPTYLFPLVERFTSEREAPAVRVRHPHQKFDVGLTAQRVYNSRLRRFLPVASRSPMRLLRAHWTAPKGKPVFFDADVTAAPATVFFCGFFLFDVFGHGCWRH